MANLRFFKRKNIYRHDHQDLSSNPPNLLSTCYAMRWLPLPPEFVAVICGRVSSVGAYSAGSRTLINLSKAFSAFPSLSRTGSSYLSRVKGQDARGKILAVQVVGSSVCRCLYCAVDPVTESLFNHGE